MNTPEVLRLTQRPIGFTGSGVCIYAVDGEVGFKDLVDLAYTLNRRRMECGSKGETVDVFTTPELVNSLLQRACSHFRERLGFLPVCVTERSTPAGLVYTVVPSGYGFQIALIHSGVEKGVVLLSDISDCVAGIVVSPDRHAVLVGCR